MAGTTLSLNKLVSSDFSEGVSWVHNKGGGGDTDVGFFVFNSLGVASAIISSVSFKINSIKTGGNNFFQEDINLNFEFGTYSGTTFTKSNSFSFASQKVKESEGNTSKTATATGSATLSGEGLCIKLTITPGSNAIGDKVVMSGFTLAVTYEIPHTHSHTSTVTTQPTCTTTGERTYTCSCGNSSYTEPIPALGHSYMDIVTPPTCTSQGYTTHNCGGCSHSYVDTYVAALGHNYVATNVVQPSGTSPGYTEYTCSNGCGGSELRDYTNSISVKAGTGCSQITVDGVEPTTEGATRDFVLWQNSVFTLYSYPKTGYVFEKWIIRDANGSVTEDTRQNLPVTLSSNISVEAVYKLATYTATFLNGDGSTLETVTVTHGSTPVCTKTPTKASTDKYIYTWDNANPWTPAIGALTGNQTYTPNFISKAYFTLSFDYNELASAYDCELVTGQQVGSGLRFTEGSVVKVTAKVKQGYVLSHWEDGSTDNPRLVTITGDIMLAVTITPILPKFTSVKMLYQNQQISETNKVLANQFFRIVVGVE